MESMDINSYDHFLDRTIWIWFVTIISTTEQAGYLILRSFPRQNNLDINSYDHFLDRTIWISNVAIISSTEQSGYQIYDLFLDWTIWIFSFTIIPSTEQSGYRILRSCPRQNNRDMKFCDNSLGNIVYDLFRQEHIVLLLVCYWLGDIIGSCLAISDVILVILDVDLDNLLNFGTQIANRILKNGFVELAGLKQTLTK